MCSLSPLSDVTVGALAAVELLFVAVLVGHEESYRTKNIKHHQASVRYQQCFNNGLASSSCVFDFLMVCDRSPQEN